MWIGPWKAQQSWFLQILKAIKLTPFSVKLSTDVNFCTSSLRVGRQYAGDHVKDVRTSCVFIILEGRRLHFLPVRGFLSCFLSVNAALRVKVTSGGG